MALKPPSSEAPVAGHLATGELTMRAENGDPAPFLETREPVERRLDNAAALRFTAEFKFGMAGVYSTLAIRVDVTDYYEAGNAAARNERFDELVEWTERAVDRNAAKFIDWRRSVGHPIPVTPAATGPQDSARDYPNFR